MAYRLGSSAAFLTILLCAASLPAQQELPVNSPPLPIAASAGVRIVRLSEVRGEAQLDRQTDRGFEAAFANLPIVQGVRLRTGEGVAEVEFEDNSTLRLTPHSLVEFPVLRLESSGARVSTVRVVEGEVYMSLTKGKENPVTLTFANQSIALTPGSHIQLDMSAAKPRLAVLDGNVQVADGANTMSVGHKKAVLFDPANSGAAALVSNAHAENTPFDAWDKQSADYHSRVAANHLAGASPYAFGGNDMSYYGSFVTTAGCGSMWRPYLASAAWDPYANGTYAYYPGAGYSWVSPYPWGWTPYHSGSWSYCPSSGWGWQPNGQWNGLNNTSNAAIVPGKQPKRFKGPVQRMPLNAPLAKEPTLIEVHTAPLIASRLSSAERFEFRQDSAGLGVPRGVFDHLNKVSAHVAEHGSVATPVYVASTLSANTATSSSTSAGRSTGTASAAHASTFSVGNTFTATPSTSGHAASSSVATFSGASFNSTSMGVTSGGFHGGSVSSSAGSGGGHH